ncbi:hypothetical protein Lsan_2024 [Legionella santicrucis]|uniref:Poly A polymerase head domain-containing protein n=1 Tax=Legionella santicrucis TaxID=45074 RepID=A0A0W0YUC5_9GAMM|nr:hypothetical protein [Legionella santicrucis]KTD60472.1 hypothetical protein Lsan_2024 [Legionella santicrucis]
MTSSLENRWNNFSDNDIELFELINKIARDNDSSYFLIGAKARDMLLDYFGKKAELRKTLDTDIALCCRQSLKEYAILFSEVEVEAIKAKRLVNINYLSKFSRIGI